MIKHLTIIPPEEDVEGQIDRLSFAVQKLMHGIELAAQTPRNPSQLSFTHPEWFDEDEEKSQEDNCSVEFEAKFEEILIHLDRSLMINEDFMSECYRREHGPLAFDNEAYVIKLEKENMELRSKSFVSRSDYTLKLKRSPALDAEKKNFEDKLAQLDKLNEIYHLKNSQILKVQEALRVKERWIDQKEKELKICWQSFEKSKAEWETLKSNDSLKMPLKGYSRFDRSPVIGTKYENFSSLSKDEPAQKFEAPPPSAPETPMSRERTIQKLQQELKDLESRLQSITFPEEHSKVVMKIDQLKNKLATLRGQKALYESSRSSRLISNMMKTMEKEVNYEENKRKQQLEKFTKKSVKGIPEPISETHNIETARRVLYAECSLSQKVPHKFADEKQVLDFRKELIEKREKEVAQRELMLQETWMKVPGSKELIEVVNLALSKLTEQKAELDNEREAFEKEKLEMLKLRDKVMEQMNKITPKS